MIWTPWSAKPSSKHTGRRTSGFVHLREAWKVLCRITSLSEKRVQHVLGLNLLLNQYLCHVLLQPKSEHVETWRTFFIYHWKQWKLLKYKSIRLKLISYYCWNGLAKLRYLLLHYRNCYTAHSTQCDQSIK